MERINLSDAKARLSEIVDRVEAGESIEIVRRGKVAAQLTPPAPARVWKAIDLELLRRLHANMRPQKQSAGDVVRRMRDDARY